MFAGKRILVVGESHYADEHEKGSTDPEMTNNAVGLYANRPSKQRWIRTFDNIAWAVSGKNRAQLEKDGRRGEIDVWNSIAFYNYITVLLANSARADRPTREQFLDSRHAFEQVLDSIKPDILLVCGYELFPWLIRNHYPSYAGDPWKFKGEWIDLPRSKTLRAVRMRHPSAAFSPSAWHNVVERAMQV